MASEATAEALAATAQRILMKVGVPPDDAAKVAGNLVAADLRGVETHGLMRLKAYVERIEAGGIAAQPDIRVLRDSPATALIDGGNGLGAVVGTAAMELAIEKAGTCGAAIVVARNLNHIGAAAYYSMMAAARGMIGMSMTNVLALMAPTGGAERVVGNNPLSFAFPSAGDDPVVWDSAMSRSTWGALLLAQQRGEPLADGAFLAADGQPTRDPAAVLAGGSLVPIAGYKGYGLALSIALLTGVLAGWKFDAELGGGHSTSTPGDNTALMAAIRISDFTDPAAFAGRVEEITDMVHAVPTQPGVDRVWLPGEKEAEMAKQRR